MRLSPENAKQLAKRIDPDVLRSRPLLERGRVLLALALGLAAGGWWIAGMLIGRADAWASPGAVAGVHAAWNDDCQQCHTPLQPIRPGAMLASAEAGTALNAKCQICHPVSHPNPPLKPGVAWDAQSTSGSIEEPLGPFGHHALQSTSDSAKMTCATCHREHLGAANSLSRTADADCTRCHARSDLAKDAIGPASLPALLKSAMLDGMTTVTSFSAAGHPYFRSLGEGEARTDKFTPKQQPRSLRFGQLSHSIHMAAGIRLGGRPLLTIGDLNPADQPRYAGGGKARDLVQLNCSSCHEPDDRTALPLSAGVAAGPPAGRGAGAHMQPVVFERHCQACHRLTFEPGADIAGFRNDPFGKTNVLAENIPHRLNARQLTAIVGGYWTNKYFKRNPDALKEPVALPGHSNEDDDVTVAEAIGRDRLQSARYINAACAKCHELDNTAAVIEAANASAPNAEAGPLNRWKPVIPSVKPTKTPATFFRHARFDHAAHRAWDCSLCHKMPDSTNRSQIPTVDPGMDYRNPENPEPPSSPLMIVNRDDCLHCHSPPHATNDTTARWARFDCAECHRYHNRDAIVPLTTATSMATAPSASRTADDR